MLINHLKTALRFLARSRTHAIINIGGLAIGMAVSILIGLWIRDELSFNKYHKNYDRIVQVLQKEKYLGKTKVWDQVPFFLLNTLKTNYAGPFKHIVPTQNSKRDLSFDGSAGIAPKKIPATGLYAGADAPEMFTLHMLSGARNGLRDQNSILLSASVARALFGSADPLDRTIVLEQRWNPDNKVPLKVTGVYEDLPANTQLHEVQYFLSWDLYLATLPRLTRMEGWEAHFIRVYAELNPGVDRDKLAAGIGDIELKTITGLTGLDEEIAANPEILLHPMSEWHLYSDFREGVADRGPVQFVQMMAIIGAFVLLLACINFMNLSTARSERRAKEVGIRKAVGSLRGQLIRQFFVESFLVVVVAFLPALLLATLALPWFNQLSGKELHMPWTDPASWALAAAFVALTGLLSGSYPALYLSSFNPVTALKGSFRAGRWSAIPRKALVVLQFSISVILIISTIIVYEQLLFAKARPVGYTREGLVMVPVTSKEFTGKYDVLRSRLKATGMVTEMAASESEVTNLSSHNGGFEWPGKPPGLNEDFGTEPVSYEYGKTVGWQFLAGRDFSRSYGTDPESFVINETAARFMGLKDPIGVKVRWQNKWINIDTTWYTIIGVVRDMVMESPYEPVKPTIFRLGPNFDWFYVRIDPRVSAHDAIGKIAGFFRELIPSTPFEYRFTDDEYEKKFSAEERVGTVATLFATLAVFISCLGLFGMALFIAEQRIREIGIRKVLGATVFTLWRLLSKEFVGLVLLSIAVAAPVAWYFMHGWLQNYPLHVAISWWIFVAAGFGTILITLLTISYQAIRAAMANPVEALRSE